MSKTDNPTKHNYTSNDIIHIRLADKTFDMYFFNNSKYHHVSQINLHTDVANISCHSIIQERILSSNCIEQPSHEHSAFNNIMHEIIFHPQTKHKESHRQQDSKNSTKRTLLTAPLTNAFPI